MGINKGKVEDLGTELPKKGPRMRRGGRGVYLSREKIKAGLKSRPRYPSPSERAMEGMWVRGRNRYYLIKKPSGVRGAVIRATRDITSRNRKAILTGYDALRAGKIGRIARKVRTPAMIAGVAGAGVLGAHLASRRMNRTRKSIVTRDVRKGSGGRFINVAGKLIPANRIRWMRSKSGKLYPIKRRNLSIGIKSKLNTLPKSITTGDIRKVIPKKSSLARWLERGRRRGYNIYANRKSSARINLGLPSNPVTFDDFKLRGYRIKQAIENRAKKSIGTGDIIKSIKERKMAEGINSAAFQKSAFNRMASSMRPGRRLGKSSSPF